MPPPCTTMCLSCSLLLTGNTKPGFWPQRARCGARAVCRRTLIRPPHQNPFGMQRGGSARVCRPPTTSRTINPLLLASSHSTKRQPSLHLPRCVASFTTCFPREPCCSLPEKAHRSRRACRWRTSITRRRGRNRSGTGSPPASLRATSAVAFADRRRDVEKLLRTRLKARNQCELVGAAPSFRGACVATN